MHIHYLEIVTDEVEATCQTWSQVHGVEFNATEQRLGNALTAKLDSGGTVGVRAPMSEDERPVVRPYWLVDDIKQAYQKILAAGAQEAHPPLEIPGLGTFAIYQLGGTQQGLWQI